MVCEKLRKVVKFTVFSENHMNEILEVTTEPTVSKRARIVKNNDGITMKVNTSKTMVKFFESIGCKVDTIHVMRRRGRKHIANLPVDVKPRRGTNYKSGVTVSCIAEADNERELDKRIWEIEDSLLSVFTSKGIPIDRICKESVVGCEYKFY